MGTINEPSAYSFDQLTPDSINEPLLKRTLYRPNINTLQPKNGVANGADISLRVVGTGFFEMSRIFINDEVRPTVLESTNRLSTTIRETQPQTLHCQVRNGIYPSNIEDFVLSAAKEK